MKCDLQMAEPRSATILRHTRQAILDRRLVVTAFANEVVDRYLATHELHQRVVKFREPAGDVDTMCDAMKHNAQVVDRYIKQVIKAFPSDLEEAWTAALPQPYRLACERELVRRRGFLGAKLKTEEDGAGACIADVMREFGEMVASSSDALRDGAFDGAERTRTVGEIDDVIAALISFRQTLATGAYPDKVRPAGPVGVRVDSGGKSNA